MQLPRSVGPDELKMAAIAVMVMLVIGVFVAMRFVQKMVFRIILLVALIGAGFFLYTQRDDLDACQKKVRASHGTECVCTFAGVKVTVPPCKTSVVGV